MNTATVVICSREEIQVALPHLSYYSGIFQQSQQHGHNGRSVVQNLREGLNQWPSLRHNQSIARVGGEHRVLRLRGRPCMAAGDCIAIGF